MNKKISMIGSVVLAVMTGIFCICQAVNTFCTVKWLNELSFLVCIFLSWGYLLCVIGHRGIGSRKRQIAADAAIVFAVIYSVFVSIVYFTQLSVVHYHVLSEDIVNAFTMSYPGSWLFVIDVAGYGIMALSTIFLGLSIESRTKADRRVKLFSYIHGIFITAIFMPLTDWFLKESSGEGVNIGALGLVIWCLIFISIPIYSFERFKESELFE